MKKSEWVGRDEYPLDRDMDAYGDDSSWDDDPLTIGHIGSKRPRFWTLGRIGIALVMLILLATILIPLIWPLLG